MERYACNLHDQFDINTHTEMWHAFDVVLYLENDKFVLKLWDYSYYTKKTTELVSEIM